MKFDCDKCGEVKTVLFDGYSFGDRTLEGVTFKATIEDGELVVDAVGGWDNDSYLRTLNKEYWLGIAKEVVQEDDVFECQECGGEAVYQ
jgi:hypothetical protein